MIVNLYKSGRYAIKTHTVALGFVLYLYYRCSVCY